MPSFRLVWIFTLVMLAGCVTPADQLAGMRELKPVTIMDAPEPVPGVRYSTEQVNRGKYMVELLGCASCHTDGALTGEPDYNLHLADSNTGIAYSNPLRQRYPGVVYPANLTPDPETGICRRSDTALIQLIRVGIDPAGGHILPVMPWPAYAKMTEDDVRAIIAYLRSLPPVRHEVPEVQPGSRATSPFVYFDVYQSVR